MSLEEEAQATQRPDAQGEGHRTTEAAMGAMGDAAAG